MLKPRRRKDRYDLNSYMNCLYLNVTSLFINGDQDNDQYVNLFS